MSTIIYSKKQLIQRVRLHIANGFPAVEFSITDNQVLLYIDSAIASTVVASMMGIAKLTREMATPEAYIITTQLNAVIKNEATGEWYSQLPQTPLSLSIGFSITSAYFSDSAFGQSQPIWLLKSKRAAYRNYMPKAGGTLGQVRGNYIYIKSSDGSSLAGLTPYVDMVSTRTNDINEPLNLPDDAIEMVFDKAVQKCMQRLGIPFDVIKDNVSTVATNVNKS